MNCYSRLTVCRCRENLFFTGRYNILSTIMYVAMGWLIVFAIKPLLNNLDINGVYWLVAGGIAYSVGAVLFSIHSLLFW